MRRFLLKMLPLFLWIFILMAVLPVAIDPYNVFHVENIRDNGVEPNKNFVKTEYISKNPDKFDAFLFGSSRVSCIHSEKIPGYRCYNMTYSEGVPKEHYDNLCVMLEHGVEPRLVIVGLDNIAFLVDPKVHEENRQRIPHPTTEWGKLRFYLQYLEPVMALESLEVTYFQPRTVAYDRNLYETGWTLDYGVSSSTDWTRAQADWTFQYESRIPEALEEIRRLKELCDEHGIELIIFTNPMHPLTFRKSVEHGYGEFLRGLAGITPFYNFSGINDITADNENFLETSHYKPHVGDLIMEVLFQGENDPSLEAQGFGMYVTQDNVEEFLKEIIETGV